MKITQEEKVALRKKAKKELERIELVYSNDELVKEINDFKNRFLICEATYKVILKEHQSKTKGKTSDYLKLDMRQVPYALTFAGYDIDDELLTKLFGSENHVGRRSAKKLRDALTHKVVDSAVNELIVRKIELYETMDSFINMIRTSV